MATVLKNFLNISIVKRKISFWLQGISIDRQVVLMGPYFAQVVVKGCYVCYLWHLKIS